MGMVRVEVMLGTAVRNGVQVGFVVGFGVGLGG